MEFSWNENWNTQYYTSFAELTDLDDPYDMQRFVTGEEVTGQRQHEPGINIKVADPDGLWRGLVPLFLENLSFLCI